jgi:hypothetical protein
MAKPKPLISFIPVYDSLTVGSPANDLAAQYRATFHTGFDMIEV